jgi:ADP-ribose pyrophosphatase YjhB (NUDIX family)
MPDHPLPEPAHCRRLPAGVGPAGIALPPRHRAAPGFLDAARRVYGETMAEAAMRETAEEACARVRNLELYGLYDLPHISQVYVFFRAELVDLDFAVGEESLEVKLFDEADIPWSELAFPTVGRTLECFFADRVAQHFPVRNEPLEALRPHFPAAYKQSSE